MIFTNTIISSMFTWPYMQSGYSAINKIKYKITEVYVLIKYEVELQCVMDLPCVDVACVLGW